jgi:hypothetical protein
MIGASYKQRKLSLIFTCDRSAVFYTKKDFSPYFEMEVLITKG